MDKLPVGQLPDLTQSNNDDEIMVITDSEHNQLKKEKISDLITDFTSTNENNALTKGTDGKMFVTDFGNASNITEGTLPTSVLPEIPLEKIPDIPKDKLPPIETSDLPVSGVTADTYAYPSSVTVNSQGQVTAIEEGTPSGANADTDLSNLTELGEKHFLNKSQITNCILSAPNGAATFSGSNITLKQGLKMLYPNGRNIDKTLKNGELTLDSDTILDLSSYSGQTFDFELMFGCNINDSYLSQNYQESDIAPTNFGGRNQIYLNTTENQMYFYVSSSSSWEKRTLIKLGKGKLENGVVTSFTPYQPVELLKRTDKAEITGWGFPSSKYDDLEYGLNGDVYNAPDNGIFCVGFSHPNNTDYINYSVDVLDQNNNFLYNVSDTKNLSGQQTCIIIQIKKGHKLRIYFGNFTVTRFRFIYAQGVSND